MLGDAGVSNDDGSYTGETGGFLSLDYVREKAREFQLSLTGLDESYRAGLAVQDVSPSDTIAALLAEYESKAGELKATAEVINAGAAMINGMGGRMPVLSIPSTLGLPPLVVPAVIATGIAAAAFYVSWSIGYRSAMTEAIATVQASTADPESKDQITRALQDARAAQGIDAGSIFSALSGPLKIGAICVLAYLAWRSFNDVFDR